jgi:hypothetical protein
MKQSGAFFPHAPEPSPRENQRRELTDRLAAPPDNGRPGRCLGRLLVIVLCMFAAGFFLENVTPVPDAAWVYVDTRGVCYPPTYLRDSGQDAAGLLLTTVGEAKKMKCVPDPRAKSMGYFRQPARSMSGSFLQGLGLLPPLQSRWNRDGTWNW